MKHKHDLYEVNYRSLINKTLKELNKWRDSMFMDRKTQHCQHVTSSQPEFWILVGTKTLKNGLTDTNNLILIFTQRNKGPGKANTILKNKLGGLTLSTSRLTIRLQESRE